MTQDLNKFCSLHFSLSAGSAQCSCLLRHAVFPPMNEWMVCGCSEGLLSDPETYPLNAG